MEVAQAAKYDDRESNDDDLEKQQHKPPSSSTTITPPIAHAVLVQTPLELDRDLARELDDAEEIFSANVRKGFLRKTFVLFVLEIIVFMGIICLFMYTPALARVAYPYNLNGTMNSNAMYLLMGTGAASLLYIVGLQCYYHSVRRHPYNLIAAFCLPVVLGTFFGCIAVRINDPILIWIAFGACVFGVLVLILFTLQSKYEFDGSSPFLTIGFMYLIGFSFLAGFFFGVPVLFVGAFCMIFLCYVIYDLQRVLKGTHYRQIRLDDPVMTSVSLFSDFVAIFSIVLCAASMGRE